jgi:hypothetical protein
MDEDQTVIGSDGDPVAASTQVLDRTRRRWWRYNGALATMRTRAARQAHGRRALGHRADVGSSESRPAPPAGMGGSSRPSAARRRAWLMS